jgi:hypothetical protein
MIQPFNHNELLPHEGAAVSKATSGSAEAHNNQKLWYQMNLGLCPKRRKTLIN